MPSPRLRGGSAVLDASAVCAGSDAAPHSSNDLLRTLRCHATSSTYAGGLFLSPHNSHAPPRTCLCHARCSTFSSHLFLLLYLCSQIRVQADSGRQGGCERGEAAVGGLRSEPPHPHRGAVTATAVLVESPGSVSIAPQAYLLLPRLTWNPNWQFTYS